MLTGPRSFSAAAEFADAVKTYQLATIVGEETGGRPNDFGNNLPFLLPNSKLTVNIATVSAVRANGSAADPNAVIPDILVRRTATDIKSGTTRCWRGPRTVRHDRFVDARGSTCS